MSNTDPFGTHHRRILEELVHLQARGEAFTLCLIVHCSGSTYRKPGALAVVRADGTRCGVISGGCLESDLDATAGAVLKDRRPQLAIFDTRGDDDLVFGSGSGCRGQMQVLMLPVAAGAPHPLCEGLIAADRAHRTLRAALVTGGPRIGSGCLWWGSLATELPPCPEPVRELRDAPPGVYPLSDRSSCAVLLVAPSPRLLVVGAGPEAPALIAIANQLGWRAILADHREALLKARGAGAERTICARPVAAFASLGDVPLDACIVMTHTAANDREALAALAGRAEPFVGLLGPPARRDELLEELEPAARASLAPRLHAPVGLELGGHGPEMLALSICAELQQFLAARARATERTAPARTASAAMVS